MLHIRDDFCRLGGPVFAKDTDYPLGVVERRDHIEQDAPDLSNGARQVIDKMESGGIVIMKNDLRDVLTAIDLSRKTVRKIKQNLFFALVYNIIGIPIAARLFTKYGLTLKPELAGLAMALSSVSVVSNSLLLKYFKPKK